ncbi:MAG: biotin--[acetyl-CoA-carboxylase] ligase [Lachnospiraceae bacterium]|nr:biotin--[acetyl-CoA-carboxylase] ligase [Lachnospiraceae bacterium]
MRTEDYRDNIDRDFSGPAILSRLHTKWLGQGGRLIFCRETGSTNADALEYARNGAEEGVLIAADMQNSGKGRRGRGWQSPSGCTISMSYLLRPAFDPDRAPMITLIMALAALKGIESVSGMELQIKWPNDIILGNKKLAGILTEMSVDSGRIEHVVVGTGINVNNPAFPPELADIATSLFIESGRSYSRASIVGEVTDIFEGYYESFRESGSLKDFVHIYNSHCVNMGRALKVLDPKGEYSGMGRGINERGELMVELPDGEIRNIYAGEVSVRGMNSYGL